MGPVAGAPVVDLEALATAQLAETPYRWGYLPHAIPRERAEEMRATFPHSGFWRLRQHDGEKFMDFRLRALVPLGATACFDPESLDPVWRRFVEGLLSPGYRSASEQALGTPLRDAQLEVSAWRWGPNAELGAHLDIPRKIASQVFYFNDEWDPAWGGCLRILRSQEIDDCVTELLPTVGSASIIIRSESSWHAVPRVHGPESAERLSVVATWQHPGSESPFWTVEDGGSVRCHTRGASPPPAE